MRFALTLGGELQPVADRSDDGDTSLKTIMDHHFDASLELMRKVMERWAEEAPQEEMAGIVSGSA